MFHDLAPLGPGLRGEDGSHPVLHGRPLPAVHLSGQVVGLAQARQFEQLGVELGLDRTNGDVVSVGALIDVVEVGAGVEQVRASLVLPQP